MDILDQIISKSKSINKITNFDSKNFKKKYLNKGEPIVLKGYGDDWPAKTKWSLDFLSGLETEEPVSLELGANNQNETDFVKQNLSSYIESIKKGDQIKGESPAYLTLFNIFSRFPHLNEDIDLSIFTKYTKKNNVYGWIGPKGTVTGFHQDSLNNMLAQVMGRKQVVLASPKQSNSMYVSDKFDLGAVSSEVDINNYNKEKHPKIQDVDFFSTVLEPGDVLFIPRKWWHYVKSIDMSISINNFGALLKDVLITETIEGIQYRLHCRGYYKKKNNCTCHKVVDGEIISKYA
ncbi:cupin-like domain-containing protein [Thalassobellus sediminis]|uniref:cupin-like domain-containing protein n=1 Tax=Thalassobellus sediminis TaxID=3367753 RepID=UPI0037AE42A4